MSIIKFAHASCRDDAEDGNPADPCPVLAALNKAKLKDSDSFLANLFYVYWKVFHTSMYFPPQKKGQNQIHGSRI